MKKREYGQFIRSFAERIRAQNWENRFVQREAFFQTGDLWHLSWIGHLASMEAALYSEEGAYRIREDSYEGLTHFHDDPLPKTSRVRQSLAVVFGTLWGEEKYSLERQRRNYRQETALSQYVSRYFARDESFAMVSLLIPETGESEEELDRSRERSQKIRDSLQVFQNERGANLTICFAADEASYTLGIECNRERRVRDYNRRPAYTWENGKCRYGDYETDASFFISDGRQFGALDVTRVKKGSETLFEALENEYFQLDFVHKVKTASSWGCVEGKEG